MTAELDIVGDAFRKIKAVGHDEPMTADELAIGRRELRRLLLSWQNHRYNLWTMRDDFPVTLTTATSYVLTGRPLRVLDVRYRNANGLDMPMRELTRQQYFDLPNKTSTGIPNGWYYARKQDAGTLYIWQPLVSVTTETLRIAGEWPIDLSDTSELDVPPEWENAVVYNLGMALTDTFGGDDLSGKAAYELGLALADDREGSIFFGEECA